MEQTEVSKNEERITPNLDARVKIKIIADELERLGQPELAQWAREVHEFLQDIA